MADTWIKPTTYSSSDPTDVIVANRSATIAKTKPSESAELILSVRGAFYRVPFSDKASPGIYAIKELTDFYTAIGRNNTDVVTGGVGNDPSPILITSIDTNQQDIVMRMACLDNAKMFYTFGQAFGEVAISGEILLGPMGEADKSTGPKRLIDFFQKYRVSSYYRPVTVSTIARSYFVYLTAIRVAAVDPNFHILPWTMLGTLLDVNQEDMKKVNPKSSVFTMGNSSLLTALPVSNAALPVVTKDASTAADIKATQADSKTKVDSILKTTPDKMTVGNAKAGSYENELSNNPSDQIDQDTKRLKVIQAQREKARLAVMPGSPEGTSDYNDVVKDSEPLKQYLENRVTKNYNTSVMGPEWAASNEELQPDIELNDNDRTLMNRIDATGVKTLNTEEEQADKKARAQASAQANYPGGYSRAYSGLLTTPVQRLNQANEQASAKTQADRDARDAAARARQDSLWNVK